jgi:hypothetical protein
MGMATAIELFWSNKPNPASHTHWRGYNTSTRPAPPYVLSWANQAQKERKGKGFGIFFGPTYIKILVNLFDLGGYFGLSISVLAFRPRKFNDQPRAQRPEATCPW